MKIPKVFENGSRVIEFIWLLFIPILENPHEKYDFRISFDGVVRQSPIKDPIDRRIDRRMAILVQVLLLRLNFADGSQ